MSVGPKLFHVPPPYSPDFNPAMEGSGTTQAIPSHSLPSPPPLCYPSASDNGQVSWFGSILIGTPIGLFSVGVLFSNNARDRVCDSEAKLVTLAHTIRPPYDYYFFATSVQRFASAS